MNNILLLNNTIFHFPFVITFYGQILYHVRKFENRTLQYEIEKSQRLFSPVSVVVWIYNFFSSFSATKRRKERQVVSFICQNQNQLLQPLVNKASLWALRIHLGCVWLWRMIRSSLLAYKCQKRWKGSACFKVAQLNRIIIIIRLQNKRKGINWT